MPVYMHGGKIKLMVTPTNLVNLVQSASVRCEADISKIWLRNPFVLIAKGRNRLWHRTPTPKRNFNIPFPVCLFKSSKKTKVGVDFGTEWSLTHSSRKLQLRAKSAMERRWHIVVYDMLVYRGIWWCIKYMLVYRGI